MFVGHIIVHSSSFIYNNIQCSLQSLVVNSAEQEGKNTEAGMSMFGPGSAIKLNISV
jgi:hypothetical protein